MDPEFLGDLLQGLAALRQPLDRLGLVLGREPAPLPLLHRSFPVLVDPTLRGCPPSRGRLKAHRSPSLSRCPWPSAGNAQSVRRLVLQRTERDDAPAGGARATR